MQCRQLIRALRAHALSFSICLLCCSLFGCKDAAEPELCSVEDYLALQTGNFWIYESYTLDEGGIRQELTRRIDTVVVKGTTVIAGRLAYILVLNNGLPQDTSFVTVDRGSAYRIMESRVDNNVERLGSRWIKFAACNAPSWQALDTNLLPSGDESDPEPQLSADRSLTLEQMPHESYQVFAELASRQSMSVRGLPHPADVFAVHTIYDFSDGKGQSLEHYAYTSRYWLVQNVGPVRIRRDSFTMFNQDSEEITVPGVEHVLLDFYVQ